MGVRKGQIQALEVGSIVGCFCGWVGSPVVATLDSGPLWPVCPIGIRSSVLLGSLHTFSARWGAPSVGYLPFLA